MGRAPCCDKANVKRGPWSPEEDAALRSYLEAHGTAGNWITLPKKAGLRRCGKSCRLRWLNYLRPDIKHGGFTEEEDNLIIGLYTEIGSRWSVIASQLPGRTDNDVKNYWNTKLKKRLLSGKISLPSPNSTIVATNSCSSTSSVGISNELAPPRDYNYHGFSVISGAGLEPSIFSTLLTDVHYRPSLMVQDPSPEIGSMVDFSGNINSSASRECSSAVNSSGNSPNSLGAVDNNRSASNSANGGAVTEYGGTNFGSGFGFSWEMLINELLLDEKAGEISPNASAEVNPHVLSQSSINYQY